MDDQLQSLSAEIRSAIQGSIRRLPWRDFSVSTLAHQFAVEVLAATRVDQESRTYAPDQFTLTIHPRETGELNTVKPELQREVAADLQTALEKCNFLLTRTPHIALATDPTLAKGEVRVIAWHSADPMDIKKSMIVEAGDVSEQPPPKAFLVVQGREHFPLTKPIINVGRRVDNDLVLEGHHVSRKHAQLRALGGRYHIVDLESTAGVRVNGRLVKEQILYAGDVIKLANVELVYGEDRTGPPDVTPPYRPLPKPRDERDAITPLDLNLQDYFEDTTSPEESDD